MEAFKKDVAIFRDENGVPLLVLDIKTITNEKEYHNLKERASNNLSIRECENKQKAYEFESKVKEHINKLAQAISILMSDKE